MVSPDGGAGAVASLLPWIDAVMVERAVWQDARARLELDRARDPAAMHPADAAERRLVLLFSGTDLESQ